MNNLEHHHSINTKTVRLKVIRNGEDPPSPPPQLPSLLEFVKFRFRCDK